MGEVTPPRLGAVHINHSTKAALPHTGAFPHRAASIDLSDFRTEASPSSAPCLAFEWQNGVSLSMSLSGMSFYVSLFEMSADF